MVFSLCWQNQQCESTSHEYNSEYMPMAAVNAAKKPRVWGCVKPGVKPCLCLLQGFLWEGKNCLLCLPLILGGWVTGWDCYNSLLMEFMLLCQRKTKLSVKSLETFWIITGVLVPRNAIASHLCKVMILCMRKRYTTVLFRFLRWCMIPKISVGKWCTKFMSVTG